MDRVREAKALRARAAAHLVDPSFGPLVKRLAPDLILVDIELQPYVIVSHGMAKTAVLCPFIAPQKVSGVPPLHTPIQPGRGLLGTRLGTELAWLRYRTWKAWKHWLPRIAAPGADRIAVLRELAESRDFPHRRQFALFDWLLPMSFRTVPIVNMNAREFDFPHTPHPAQRHTGPLIRVDRKDDADAKRPEEASALSRFLEERDSKRKLVYCAFGTAFAGDDSAFIARLIDAVRERVDWDVVITLGGRQLSERPGQLPGHIHVFDWVAQLAILEHADCAVLHAGPGSIYECIHFEVPMVLFPFRVNDQLGYAARAGYHGLGSLGDRDADTPADIRDRIGAVLDDPKYGAAVRAMKGRLCRYEDDEIAVRIVEDLLPVAADAR